MAILINLTLPTLALADDGAPPPVSTEEISTPVPIQETATPTPAATLPDETETTTLAGESTPLANLQLDFVSEVMEQLPEDTQIVALNENGEALPLVTQEAEQAILASDPMWCPVGVIPGGIGCSPTQTSMTDLLNWLAINDPNQAGTIWIEDSYDSSINAGDAGVTTGFVLDGSSLFNMANNALTIQGGWNGVSGSATITGTSAFSGDYLSVINWNDHVTINNILVDGSTGNGIEVGTAGDIILNNVTAKNNDSDGAYLDNTSGTGAISVTGGTFNDNDSDGLEAYSNGSVTLKYVTAGDNDMDGAYLDNTSGTGNIFITNSQFNENNLGSEVYSNGKITLNNVIASYNLAVGATLDICGCISAEGITINASAFNNNAFAGLVFLTDGSVKITDTTANNNGVGGIGGDALGDITIAGVIASNNQHGFGFSTPGDVTIKCGSATNNSIDGVYVYANNLNLVGSTITNNGIDYDNGSGAINIFEYNCNSANGESGKPVSGSGLPLHLVSGNGANLDCDNYSGTILILSNGDKVTFKCPITGSATLNPLTADELENPLPDELTLASGMLAIQSPDGSDTPLDGLVIIDFIVPVELQGSNFAILYWNGSEWVDLAEATFDDGRTVWNGGFLAANGYFEAITNFSGNFILAKK